MAQQLVATTQRLEVNNIRSFDRARSRQQQCCRDEDLKPTGVFLEAAAHPPGESDKLRVCAVCGLKTRDCCMSRHCYGASGGVPTHFGDCWVLWHLGVWGIGKDNVAAAMATLLSHLRRVVSRPSAAADSPAVSDGEEDVGHADDEPDT
eukprot:GHUV01027148.1.p2 GENE.GHUV01027148.1~~GHUV01027148.1.p2  ORF type:complete len:149 (+),score=44.54 GHUV01027148.1:1321-1767(+)